MCHSSGFWIQLPYVHRDMLSSIDARAYTSDWQSISRRDATACRYSVHQSIKTMRTNSIMRPAATSGRADSASGRNSQPHRPSAHLPERKKPALGVRRSSCVECIVSKTSERVSCGWCNQQSIPRLLYEMTMYVIISKDDSHILFDWRIQYWICSAAFRRIERKKNEWMWCQVKYWSSIYGQTRALTLCK